MRDILAHAWDDVDLDEVWRVVTDELMDLVDASELFVQTEG
jgi:uncharacterized protein with HEPN domain